MRAETRTELLAIKAFLKRCKRPDDRQLEDAIGRIITALIAEDDAKKRRKEQRAEMRALVKPPA